ncbi:ATP-dependent RecD-like DNA helicase [Microbacterium sp. M]|uniref:ATP-dependent DNA helicase n=1 Tax=Microbacterium sp. M TaxID=3377125 RepID=UPI003869E3EF
MATVEEQVRSADSAICQNIASLARDRGLLSQNLLSQLRNLVEGLAVWAHAKDSSVEFRDNHQVARAMEFVKANAKVRRLSRFHDQLQASVSHFTLDRDPSERLMLKYYEYMLRTRELAKQHLGVDLLANLEDFPVDLDPSLRDYHEKIAARIDAVLSASAEGRSDRYYVHSSRPFFLDGRIYYEVTFSVAHNRASKSDRSIAFTDIDITEHYAARLELVSDSIDVLGKTMPILVIRSWAVSIRPCEFDNFARLFDVQTKVQSGHAEYRNLMQYLTTTHSSLLDLVDMADLDYAQIRTWALAESRRAALIFPVLDRARTLVRANRPGARIIRYLMLRMHNQVIKEQFDPTPNGWLSRLCLTSRSAPFDTMPFCSAPAGHVPRFGDLAESLSTTGREHELLARRVRNNVEQHGSIYTPVADVEHLGDVDRLIARYNRLLPNIPRHAPRKLAHDNGHVFIVGYEDDAVSIIEQLQEAAGSGIEAHAGDVQTWLDQYPDVIDDDKKVEALKALFAHSNVALVYGAAGTGKSTMVNHIANYFADERKLFLAHTNPAVDNLRRRVDAPNSSFNTVTKHVYASSTFGSRYGVVVIDECSTLSNASLLKVLENTTFDLLVLVGDVYQIESIEFGNWFALARGYLPQGAVFELTRPFRTNDEALLTLWDRVRKLDDRIEESLSRNGYSKVLGDTLFQKESDDEIVLCLNYDGLYGINNVNRFLQASNPEPAATWGQAVYKVGDPVLFNETDRFRPVIFNNLKGTIAKIDRVPGRITFDVRLDRELAEDDLEDTELRWAGERTVRFDVFESVSSDDDDDQANTLVPFQIAYAVSIHKAQGLEYDSVKVVITDANEERISHSIFYTAITRARRRLGIYWTPETQHRILSRLAVHENTKDENLLRTRRGVTPVAKRPKRQKDRARP